VYLFLPPRTFTFLFLVVHFFFFPVFFLGVFRFLLSCLQISGDFFPRVPHSPPWFFRGIPSPIILLRTDVCRGLLLLYSYFSFLPDRCVSELFMVLHTMAAKIRRIILSESTTFSSNCWKWVPLSIFFSCVFGGSLHLLLVWTAGELVEFYSFVDLFFPFGELVALTLVRSRLRVSKPFRP